MFRRSLFAAVAAAFLATLAAPSLAGAAEPAKKDAAKTDKKAAETYECPMKCTEPAHAPGKCTKCGMNLVKKEEAAKKDEKK